MGKIGDLWRSMTARGIVSGYLLHTGMIVSIRSTFEWLVTSVLVVKVGNKKQTIVFTGKMSYTVVVMPRS